MVWGFLEGLQRGLRHSGVGEMRNARQNNMYTETSCSKFGKRITQDDHAFLIQLFT